MAARRIGLYGGSFNPIHHGHLNVARQALADLALDTLLVLPANVSPFKTDAASRADARRAEEVLLPRLPLVRAVFADEPRVVVDDRELRRAGVSYAIDTVREIASENPDAELFFIIGEDSVEGLPRWKEIDALRALCTFKAYPRTPESSTAVRRLFAENGVVRNPDARVHEAVAQGVLRKGGFCPCRLQKLPAFFCPCDEFRTQLADPSYRGFCHCRLYLKPSEGSCSA